jgi:hypothetical protein
LEQRRTGPARSQVRDPRWLAWAVCLVGDALLVCRLAVERALGILDDGWRSV